jgi:hypothetical protein
MPPFNYLEGIDSDYPHHDECGESGSLSAKNVNEQQLICIPEKEGPVARVKHATGRLKGANLGR